MYDVTDPGMDAAVADAGLSDDIIPPPRPEDDVIQWGGEAG